MYRFRKVSPRDIRIRLVSGRHLGHGDCNGDCDRCLKAVGCTQTQAESESLGSGGVNYLGVGSGFRFDEVARGIDNLRELGDEPQTATMAAG